MSARDRAIVAAYQSGRTHEDIAREFRLTRERVGQIVRRSGITWRGGGAHVRAERRESEK